MNSRVHRWQALIAFISVMVGLFLGVAPAVFSQKMGAGAAANSGESEAPANSPAAPPPAVALPPLRVYEWGVTTLNWDGSAEADEEMPSAIFAAGGVPVEPPVMRGQKPEVKLPRESQPPTGEKGEEKKAEEKKPVAVPAAPARAAIRPIKPRKPVIYFEHDFAAQQRIVFDVDVRFSNGRATWLYPKPNRRLDPAVVQWDNVEIINAATTAPAGGFPKPAAFPADHWAAISREGSTSRLLAGGAVENYLFYEGEQFGLAELDLYLGADGTLHLGNHGAHAVYDVRVRVVVSAEPRSYFVATLPAASGEVPADLVLTDAHKVQAVAAGALAAETQAAGLTAAQAKVFETIWRRQLCEGENTLSWRRDKRALDEAIDLQVTLPPGITAEVQRVGYMLASQVDLSRQANLDIQAQKAAGGDAESAKAVKTAGMAGAGAIRRLMHGGGLGLKSRLALARLLDEMGRSPAEE